MSEVEFPIVVPIRIKKDRAKAALRDVGKETSAVDGRMRGLKKLAGGLFAGFSAVAAVAGLKRVATEANRAFLSMDAIRRAARVTGADLDFLADETQRLGADFEASALRLGQMSISFEHAGLTADHVKESWLSVAEAGTVLGLSAARQELALLAIQQMASKSVISMEELKRQLAEQIPGALGLMASGLDKTVPQLIKLIESGQLLAKDALPALAAEMKKTFGPGVADAITSRQAEIGRMKNEFFLLAAAIGEGLPVEPFVSSIARGTRAWREWLTEGKKVDELLEELVPRTEAAAAGFRNLALEVERSAEAKKVLAAVDAYNRLQDELAAVQSRYAGLTDEELAGVLGIKLQGRVARLLAALEKMPEEIDTARQALADIGEASEEAAGVIGTPGDPGTLSGNLAGLSAALRLIEATEAHAKIEAQAQAWHELLGEMSPGIEILKQLAAQQIANEKAAGAHNRALREQNEILESLSLSYHELREMIRGANNTYYELASINWEAWAERQEAALHASREGVEQWARSWVSVRQEIETTAQLIERVASGAAADAASYGLSAEQEEELLRARLGLTIETVSAEQELLLKIAAINKLRGKGNELTEKEIKDLERAAGLTEDWAQKLERAAGAFASMDSDMGPLLSGLAQAGAIIAQMAQDSQVTADGIAGAATAAAGGAAGSGMLGRTGTAVAEGASTGYEITGSWWGALIGAFVGFLDDFATEFEEGAAEAQTRLGRLDETLKLVAAAGQQSGVEVFTQSSAILNQILDLFNGIVESVGGTLESLHHLEVKIRTDSGGIRILLEGVEQSFGEDVAGAIEYAVTGLLKRAEIGGLSPIIATAIQTFTGNTLEQLQGHLAKAFLIESMNLDPVELALREQLAGLNTLLRDAFLEIGAGAEDVLMGQNGIMGTIQSAYDQIFGIAPDVEAQTRAQIEMLQTRIEVERASLMAMAAQIEALRAETMAKINSGRVSVELAIAQGISAEASAAALAALAGAVAQLDNLLATGFDASAIEAAIARARGAAGRGRGSSGGGYLGSVQARQEARWEILRELAGETASAAGDVAGQLRDGLEHMRRLSTFSEGQMDQWAALFAEGVLREGLQPFEELVQAAGETDLETAARHLAELYAAQEDYYRDLAELGVLSAEQLAEALGTLADARAAEEAQAAEAAAAAAERAEEEAARAVEEEARRRSDIVSPYADLLADDSLGGQLEGIRARAREAAAALQESGDAVEVQADLADLLATIAAGAAVEMEQLGEQVAGVLGIDLISGVDAWVDAMIFARENAEELGLTTDQLAQAWLSMAQQQAQALGGLIQTAMPHITDPEDRKRLQEFLVRLAQDEYRLRLLSAELTIMTLQAEYEAQGLLNEITRELFDSMADALDILGDNLDEILEGIGDGVVDAVNSGLAGGPGTTFPEADAAAAFLAQLEQMILAETQASVDPLSAWTMRIDEMRDRAEDLSSFFGGLGTSIEEVREQLDLLHQLGVDRLLGEATGNLANAFQDLIDGPLSGLSDRQRFEAQESEIMRLMEQAQTGTDAERYIAMQQLAADLPGFFDLAQSGLGAGFGSFRTGILALAAQIPGLAEMLGIPGGVPGVPDVGGPGDGGGDFDPFGLGLGLGPVPPDIQPITLRLDRLIQIAEGTRVDASEFGQLGVRQRDRQAELAEDAALLARRQRPPERGRYA